MEEEFQLLEQNKTIEPSASRGRDEPQHYDMSLAALGASMVDGFKQRNAFILTEVSDKPRYLTAG